MLYTFDIPLAGLLVFGYYLHILFKKHANRLIKLFNAVTLYNIVLKRAVLLSMASICGTDKGCLYYYILTTGGGAKG